MFLFNEKNGRFDLDRGNYVIVSYFSYYITILTILYFFDNITNIFPKKNGFLPRMF